VAPHPHSFRGGVRPRNRLSPDRNPRGSPTGMQIPVHGVVTVRCAQGCTTQNVQRDVMD
jgi:hypothetical protein